MKIRYKVKGCLNISEARDLKVGMRLCCVKNLNYSTAEVAFSGEVFMITARQGSGNNEYPFIATITVTNRTKVICKNIGISTTALNHFKVYEN